MQIVQEFVLGRKLFLLAGQRKVLPWSSVEQLLYTRTPSGTTFREELQKSSNINDPKRSRLLQMGDYRQKHFAQDFIELFRAFGAMSCSIPQDRIFALVGLVDTHFAETQLSSIINYDLTV